MWSAAACRRCMPSRLAGTCSNRELRPPRSQHREVVRRTQIRRECTPHRKPRSGPLWSAAACRRCMPSRLAGTCSDRELRPPRSQHREVVRRIQIRRECTPHRKPRSGPLWSAAACRRCMPSRLAGTCCKQSQSPRIARNKHRPASEAAIPPSSCNQAIRSSV